LVKGLIVNKFRGDYSLLEPGIGMLEKRARKPVVGVMRYIHDLRVAEEDAVALDRPRPGVGTGGRLKVAVIRLPHISNFDDFEPLAAERGVELTYVVAPAALEGAALIVLPGTKNTRGDLRWLRERGLDSAIVAAHAAGTAVIGVCGGFQMLGECVDDPLGSEGAPGSESGLGLLPVQTSFAPAKTTRRVGGRVACAAGLLSGLEGMPIEGYEIHMGETVSGGAPAFLLGPAGRPDGAVSSDGRVFGTYVHGLFANDGFRAGLLRNLGAEAGGSEWDPEAHIDALAAQARMYLDIDRIREIAGV
jgi:adenosylcobyric acid synthase